MIGHLGQLITEYGYLVVGLFIFFEGMALPFPTATTLVTAAAFAAHGRLSPLVLFVISTSAAVLGTTIAFVAGKRGGTFFERHARKVNPAVLARAHAFFERHGGSAVITGRFIPIARMLISPLAGVSGMTLWQFTIFNAIGAAIWSAVFIGIGYFFGQHPPTFGPGLVRAALVVAMGLALLATVAVAGGWLVEESDAAWRAEGTIWHRVLKTAPVRWLASHSPRARRFLFRRFTPEHYLGLNLTIGLGLSFIALVIFGAIIKALVSRNAVPEFDLAFAEALRESATSAGLALWSAASRLGSPAYYLVPGAVLSLVFIRRRDWLPAVGWAAAMLGSALLYLVVRHFFVHTHVAASVARAAAIGAPSTQSLSSFVGYGTIGYMLVLLISRRPAATFIVSATFLLVLAISFGRLYTGERYFSDVVSGLAAGGVWLSACITGLEVARRRRERDRRIGPGRL